MSEKTKPEKLFNSRYISIFIVNMIISISFYMVSTTLSLHVKSLGVAIADTGAIVGIMSIAAMAVRPFSGWISDHMNRKTVICVSLGVICLSMAGYGFARSTPVFIMLRILHGVSFGICSTALMAFVASYIPEARLGEGMGYFGLGQTLAIAIGPSIGLAIGNGFGFSLTFFISAGCIVAAIVLALVFTGSGAGAVEKKEGSFRDNLRLSNFFAKEALLYGIFSIAIGAVNGFENSFLTLYGKQLGLANIGWYFTICAVVLFGSRLIFGRIMDKKGFAVIFFPGMIFIAAALLLFSIATPAGAAVLFAVAAVLKSLGVGAIQPSLQAQCIRLVQPEKRGAAASTYYFGADIGQGFSPIAGGAIAQSCGYSLTYALYIIPILACVAIYGIIRIFRKPHPPANTEEMDH